LLGVLAFALIFFLTMFVGVAVVVGAMNVGPREAALFTLLPATLLGLAAAIHGPSRRFFSWIIFLS